MVLQVNQELCSGCGVCMGVCPSGAIQMVDQRAEIDDVLCTQCEACVDVCPNEAISALSIPTRSLPVAVLTAPESRPALVQSKVALPEATSPARTAVQLAGTALAFIGREAAPRLIDVLVTALERRLTAPETSASPSLPIPSSDPAGSSRGIRKQIRFRRGRTGTKNCKGRR
jgi:Pyruvate/2-oxoacid:ferredoxin oxidoreductase delta subunit